MGSLEKSLDEQRNAAQPDAQWVEAIDKIAQLTRESTIKWSAVEASAVKAPGQTVISAYQSEFEGKTLLLQETVAEGRKASREGGRVLGFLDDPLSEAIKTGMDQVLLHRKNLSLRIVDDNRSPLFVFPNVPNVVELMAAIKYQLADIDSFLSSLRVYATAGPVRSGSSE